MPRKWYLTAGHGMGFKEGQVGAWRIGRLCWEADKAERRKKRALMNVIEEDTD